MCNFIQRYWHRRLRRIDERTLVPAILVKIGGNKIPVAIWETFMDLEGFDHWKCACAPERPEFLEKEETCTTK